MPYQQNIPQPSDQLSDSQSDILGNFQALKTLIDIDHKTFGDPNEGKHAKISLPNFSSTPTFTGTDVGIYSNTSTLTSRNELFIRHSDGTTEIPITLYERNQTGYTYLPSGFLIKWGSGSGSGNVAVTYATGATIPAFTTVYSVMITTEDSSSGDVDTFVRLRSFSATQILVYCASRTTSGAASASFRYLAIGI